MHVIRQYLHHPNRKPLFMKYLLEIMAQTIAYVVAVLFIAILCMWKFRFGPVLDLTKDYLQTVSDPIYNLFKIKTKYYYDYNTPKSHRA